MNDHELLDQLRQLARQELNEVLSADLTVPLPDGTEKFSMGLTPEDLGSLEPSMLRWKVLEWIGQYVAAKLGYVDMGDGKMKHIDELNLEDAPRLEKAIEAKHKRFEAVMGLASFILEAAQDMEELGIEVDQDGMVGDWLGKD